MRHKLRLRITRTIALIGFLIIVFYLYTSFVCQQPTPTSFAKPPTFQSNFNVTYDDYVPSKPSPIFAGAIQSLWAHWSKIFHDARPTARKIVLSSNAQPWNIPNKDKSPREAPENRVSNPEADIESIRSAHKILLDILQAEDNGKDIFNGYGIVTVGGGEYFGPAIIGLHMLRKTGCTLPVEVFVADTGEYEPKLCDEYLPRLGARCLVLSDFLKDKDKEHNFEVTHYQLKSLAMLFSSFAEILYLDSDSIPLVDPFVELFSTEPYNSTGLVIWPDFWISTESPLFYSVAGLPSFPKNLPKSSSEAGQLLINKKTHLKTLLLAIYYNIYGPDYYYPLLSQGVIGQGDKETFMAAALVLGEPYYRVKTGVVSIGRSNGEEWKGSGMIQHHPSDDVLHTQPLDTQVRPAFVHANTPKMNAGHLVDEGDLFSVRTRGSRVRLWGPKSLQENLFGVDLEKLVWELLVKTGCELEKVVKEWKGRERLCERLEEHWKKMF